MECRLGRGGLAADLSALPWASAGLAEFLSAAALGQRI